MVNICKSNSGTYSDLEFNYRNFKLRLGMHQEISKLERLKEFTSRYNWKDTLLKLDNNFVLTFNVVNLMKDYLAYHFEILMKASFHLLLLRTFISAPTPEIKTRLRQEMENTRKDLQSSYCFLFSKLKRSKKFESIDKIFLTISLASREFFEQAILFFERNKKKRSIEKFIQNQALQKGGQPLEIEKYVYLMLVYETLGKVISPSSFQLLRKKYIKKKIYHQEGVSVANILKSLTVIKSELSKKKVKINKLKRRARVEDQFEKQLKELLKIDYGFEDISHQSQKKLEKKIDIVSQTLAYLLKQREDEMIRIECPKTKKKENEQINMKSISVSVKENYHINQYSHSHSLTRPSFASKETSSEMDSIFPSLLKAKSNSLSSLSNLNFYEKRQNLKARILNSIKKEQKKQLKNSVIKKGIKFKKVKTLIFAQSRDNDLTRSIVQEKGKTKKIKVEKMNEHFFQKKLPSHSLKQQRTEKQDIKVGDYEKQPPSITQNRSQLVEKQDEKEELKNNISSIIHGKENFQLIESQQDSIDKKKSKWGLRKKKLQKFRRIKIMQKQFFEEEKNRRETIEQMLRKDSIQKLIQHQG